MSATSRGTTLQVTTPVFIPDGLAISATVIQGETIVNRALFLPELAHMHGGLCWPIEGLTLKDIEDTIQMAIPPFVARISLIFLSMARCSPGQSR
jgi:hypothetical protein